MYMGTHAESIEKLISMMVRLVELTLSSAIGVLSKQKRLQLVHSRLTCGIIAAPILQVDCSYETDDTDPVNLASKNAHHHLN